MYMRKPKKELVDLILGTFIYLLVVGNVYIVASKYEGDAFKNIQLNLGAYSF